MKLLVLRVKATNNLDSFVVDIPPVLDSLVPFAVEDILAFVEGTLVAASSAVVPSSVVVHTSTVAASSTVVASCLAIASFQVISTSFAAMVARPFAVKELLLLPHQLVATCISSEVDQLSYLCRPLTTIHQGPQLRT